MGGWVMWRERAGADVVVVGCAWRQGVAWDELGEGAPAGWGCRPCNCVSCTRAELPAALPSPPFSLPCLTRSQ